MLEFISIFLNYKSPPLAKAVFRLFNSILRPPYSLIRDVPRPFSRGGWWGKEERVKFADGVYKFANIICKIATRTQ